jgi:hypothetical protein
MNLASYTELDGIDIYGQDLCRIWMYDNVLPTKSIPLFAHFLKQATDRQTRLNSEGRSMVVDGKKINLGGWHKRHDYIKLWDILDYREYYHQTADTVKAWSETKLQTLPAALKQLIDLIEQHEKEPFVVLRFFVNLFPADTAMEIHSDGEKFRLNMDLEEKDLWSATYYLQLPEQGGELWFPGTDFCHKPSLNSFAIFNGNKFMHGVKGSPLGDRDRISITIRYAKIADMFWPGHPDKFLYKPNLDTLID